MSNVHRIGDYESGNNAPRRPGRMASAIPFLGMLAHLSGPIF